MKKIISKKYKGEKYGFKDADLHELTTAENANKYFKVNSEGTGIEVGEGGGGGGGSTLTVTYKMVDGSKEILTLQGTHTHKDPEENCLVFYQDSSFGSFTIQVADSNKHWDGILEYSSDGTNWYEWEPATSITSGYFPDKGTEELRIRGIGNTYITGTASTDVAWQFGSMMNGEICCKGNIETLLDYQTVANGGHPPMGQYAFTCLFNDQYSNLKIPPAHRGITVTEECYRSMYGECPYLTAIPALYATNIDSFGAYEYMFSGCPSLKFSETKTDECPNEYRIPIEGTGTATGSAWNYEMMSSTSGSFTSDPQINTTYYTNATVIY